MYFVDRYSVQNRNTLNKRAYIDYKIRLVDHLVSDHGDRMTLANSVEVRYPFLDKDFVEFSNDCSLGTEIERFSRKIHPEENGQQVDTERSN